MIEVACDGSIASNPGGACGWGFTAIDRETGELHEEYGGRGAAEGNSNNRGEMAALMFSLLWLAGRPAEIYSDSQYVVEGMTLRKASLVNKNWMRMSHGHWEPVKNRDLWVKLHRLHLSDRQLIRWVRGHNGHAANERADALALLGRQSVTGAGPTSFTHVRLNHQEAAA